MQRLNFTCPKCGGHKIEEIMADVTVISEVNDIVGDDGVRLDFSYDDQTNDGGEIDRYQCADCGHCVGYGGRDIRDELEENGWLVDIEERLKYLRGEIEAERISCEEIAELQGLAEYIDPGDTLLLEWAGVPEQDECPVAPEEQGKPPFLIQQEFDDEPVYIVDDEDEEIVAIAATEHLTPDQRSRLAKMIVAELAKMTSE